ncbi:MAG: hypothetical protein WCV73_04385 [Patescibacteria group bacterium]|jgi:hypothetical protein
MISKNIKKILWSLGLFLLPVNALLAITPDERFRNLADKSGFDTNVSITKITIVTEIITYALGFVALFFLIMILYSGYQWMSAGGNDETIEQAKSRMKNAILGFVVIMISYSLALLVISFFNASISNRYL